MAMEAEMEPEEIRNEIILCVDDEKIALDTLNRQLFRYFQDRYDYEFAESGEEAIKLIGELGTKGRRVKLVIVDQIMPGMTGDELLASIHNTYPSIIKIMLTGQASLESAINVINKANIYKYMTKPWDEQFLMQIIEKGLQQSQLEKQKKHQLELFHIDTQNIVSKFIKHTTKEDFQGLLQEQRKIFVYKQFPADQLTPVLAYHLLAEQGGDSCLIKIHHPLEDYHYSFLGFFPYLTYAVKDMEETLTKDGKTTKEVARDPMDTLWTITQQVTPVGTDVLPSSLGGLVGFIGHDAIRLWENIPKLLADSDYPDILFQAYRLMLCFDHKRTLLTLGVVVDPDEENYGKAFAEIDHYFETLNQPAHLPASCGLKKDAKVDAEVDTDDETFRGMVEKVKEEIGRGNALKVILSRTFKRSFKISPLSLYRATIMINPSPYHFLLNQKEYAIVGASPEKLISVQNGEVESVPVAGTAARTGTAADALIEEQLLSDPKINIEHMLPVDVVRSDLAAVSIPGTVKVTKLKSIERFSHVIHVVSYLKSTLRKNLTPLDAVKASFPAGTLCGVPRIRSLELIEKIEFTRRGPYGGVLCVMDNKGNLDSGILIRTALLKDNVASVRTGAGIVFDSDPQKEADETRQKSKSMMEAMNMAEDYFYDYNYR